MHAAASSLSVDGLYSLVFVTGEATTTATLCAWALTTEPGCAGCVRGAAAAGWPDSLFDSCARARKATQTPLTINNRDDLTFIFITIHLGFDSLTAHIPIPQVRQTVSQIVM